MNCEKEPVAFADIDWNGLWYETQIGRRPRFRDPTFWDKRAPEFARNVKTDDYTDRFIKILQPQPEWRILDIGSAAGTLAVPLARRVAHVTAVDPSTGMRELLEARCRRNSIHNIQIVDGRWEDDWNRLGISVHDVAIASRSLIVKDLRNAILKLQRYSTQRVCLSTLVGDGPHDRKIVEATGRCFNPCPDYIVVLNLLHQMDIFPNLVFTCGRQQKTYHDVDDAVADMRWMIQEMTPREEEKLRVHLTGTLVREGDRLKLPYSKIVRWAVIWWDVTDSEC
jgi:FkbM family methyltransferase